MKNNFRIIFILIVFFFVAFMREVCAQEYSIIQLTNNEYVDEYPKIDNNRVAWQGHDGHDEEIFLYNGTKIIQLTNNNYSDYSPQIHNGQVVWVGDDGNGSEIFLYNGSDTIQLTNNNYGHHSPKIDNGQIVWMDGDGSDGEIFLYNGAKTIQLTNNNYSDYSPQIHNGQVVWVGDNRDGGEIFLYNGAKTIQLTNNNYSNHFPQIHNGQVVWEEGVGSDSEILLYNGTKTIQLTNNNYSDHSPQIHNGQVVWVGDDGNGGEIFLYNGSSTIQLTNNNYYDVAPKIHNGQIVWLRYDSSDNKVFIYNGTTTIQLTNNYDDQIPEIYNGQVVWERYDGQDYEIYMAVPAEKITVSGVIRYENKPYNETGVGDPAALEFKPVRFAKIEVVRDSDKSILKTGKTDADGAYSIEVQCASGEKIFLKCYAEQQNEDYNIVVKDMTGDTYSKDSEVTIVKSDKEAINLDISADTGKGGAFNILDTVMRGSDKVKELSGSVPPLITVKWQVGVDPGTAYGNNVIELNGSSNDPDEYDDCVILHEYGHFVAVKYSYDKSPGGDHRANDTNQDIRLSWSEGWAYFFSSMVRNTPLLIDTDKDSQGNSRCAVFDIETLGHSRYGSLIDYAQGQDTEVSVSSVLWDIYDPINDAGDALALGASPIWIVVHSFNGSYDCALEDFYNGIFINPANEAYRSQINSIFSERKVFYSTPFFKRGKIFTKTDGSAIPSGMPDGLSSVLAVSDDLSILNMNVFVDLPHNQRSDLLVKLISPSKKEAILHNHTNPQSGQRESIFTWYQPPYETIPDGDVPGTGQAVNAFDIFKNEPSKGDWILKVTDAGGQQSGNAGILDRWKLEISRNQPPEFELIGDKTVDEGKLLEFNILAKDPNNQALTYSATGLPYGAYFIPEKRLVSWLSDYNQQGEYTVHFEVTNGSLKDAEDIKIIVNDVTIKPVSGKSVGVGLKVRVIE